MTSIIQLLDEELARLHAARSILASLVISTSRSTKQPTTRVPTAVAPPNAPPEPTMIRLPARERRVPRTRRASPAVAVSTALSAKIPSGPVVVSPGDLARQRTPAAQTSSLVTSAELGSFAAMVRAAKRQLSYLLTLEIALEHVGHALSSHLGELSQILGIARYRRCGHRSALASGREQRTL